MQHKTEVVPHGLENVFEITAILPGFVKTDMPDKSYKGQCFYESTSHIRGKNGQKCAFCAAKR